MDNKKYQKATAKFAVYPKDKALEYLTCGLTSEAGEVAGKMKKAMRGDYAGRPGDFQYDMEAEIGDVLWYCSELCTAMGVALEDVMSQNILKLEDRQARGKLKGSGDNR